MRELFAWLWQQRQDELEAIGHRIVHGGATFTAPVCINDDVLDKLSKLEPLAPHLLDLLVELRCILRQGAEGHSEGAECLAGQDLIGP